MNIVFLLICTWFVTQSQAVHCMKQKSNIAKSMAYSCSQMLILSDDVVITNHDLMSVVRVTTG